MSYMFALGEKQKARVDACGRVQLQDNEATQLAWTKALCVVITVLSTVFSVRNGATVAGLFIAIGVVLVFKLAQLTTKYKRLSGTEAGLFIMATVAWVAVSFGTLLYMTSIGWYADH